MRLVSCFFCLLCSVILSGCNVTFPQIDSALTRVKSELAKQSESSPPEDIRWVASFNGQGRIMTAYVENGLTVFVSDEDDAIAFDGWLVRSIGGFGKGSIIIVQDSQQGRFVTDGQMTSSTLCDQWAKSIADDGNIVWSQSCADQPSDNRLVLNAEGFIVGIYQVIGDFGGEVALSKLQ